MNREQLLNYISQVVAEIFNNVATADDLTDDKKTQALIQSIFLSLDRMGITMAEFMPLIISDSFDAGIDEATNELKESIDAADMNTASALAGASITVSEASAVILAAIENPLPAVQKRIHLEAVNIIADDTLLDLQAAIRTAKQNANTTITKTLEEVKGTMARGLITGDMNKTITKEVARQFQQGGLTSFVTKDGKRLPLDFYTKAVVETKIRTAHVEGANKRYTEAGVGLVQIHENDNSCGICAKYKDMVVSLTGEHDGFKSKGDDDVKLPPYHPSCFGTVKPFVSDFKTPEEIQKEKDKWRSWKPDKDTRTKAQKEAYEKEQAIRRKANYEKKQYARWQMALGNDNFKTIGAFRRAKRTNSVKFQEIQSEYRRIMREDVVK